MKKIAFALLLVGCAGFKPQSTVFGPSLDARVSKVPTRIIDAHAHFNGESAATWGPSADIQAEFLENGVVAAVIHAPISYPIPQKRVALKNGRVVVCAAAIPNADIKSYERAIVEGRIQCLKVYLGYIPRYATDKGYLDYYALAGRYRIPVVFHTGDTDDKKAMIKYADPLTIDEIAVRYPSVTFVIAHMGNPWIQTAAEVVYKNDNVFADLSAFVIGDLGKMSPESLEELVIKPIRWVTHYVENPRKLMFGTDWPLTRVRPYIELIARAIPEENWDDVFYGNAARTFGFDRGNDAPQGIKKLASSHR